MRQARQDKKIMQVTLKKVNNLLQTLVSITLQDLNKRQRTNVETLVTIHVHQRDVSEELTNNKIKSPTDFEWLRQTRFYWSTDTDNCKIQITDIDFTYQNEYLGSTSVSLSRPDRPLLYNPCSGHRNVPGWRSCRSRRNR